MKHEILIKFLYRLILMHSMFILITFYIFILEEFAKKQFIVNQNSQL